MLNLIKQVVKAVVPAPILASGMIALERQRLGSVPKAEFAADRLRRLSRLQIQTAFDDVAIGTAWRQDLAEIERTMPYTDIYGGVCPGERRALYQMIAWLKPQQVLEIGTHIGASTLVIAKALARHSGLNARLLTADILDVNHPAQGAFSKLGTISPQAGLRQLGIETHVQFEVVPALALMKKLDRKFDFIFLDGDHSATAVYQELSLALNILAPNGLILLHDFYPNGERIYPTGMVVPGPFVGAERVCREIPHLKFLALGELPWETKLGVRRTSLALVVRAD